MFAAAGLPYTGEIEKVPNSRRALILAEHARDVGRYEPLHGRLFDAYWARGRDLGDHGVLLEEAEAAGLDPRAARDALDDPALLARVRAETARAAETGAGGVPAWLVDDRLLVPGAQPHDLFERVLERLGHEPITEPG